METKNQRKNMDKYQNNALVEEMDAIILLNNTVLLSQIFPILLSQDIFNPLLKSKKKIFGWFRALFPTKS